MKHFLTLFLTIFIALTVSAQSKDKDQVANAVEQLRKAMIDGEKKALENIVHDSLTYGHSGGHVENKAEFVEKIVSGKSDFVAIEHSNQKIQIFNDIAIVRHTLNATTNNDGKPGEVSLLIILVWKKQGNTWKLLARQAVKNAH